MSVFDVCGPLTNDLLERFGKHADDSGRDNGPRTEDIDELRDSGYFTIAVPEEFGGRGLTLREVAREQRRLAYRAPATALAVNMHHYSVGAAACAHRAGDSSVDWLLHEAANGAIFTVGHDDTGQDLALAPSGVRAEPAGGGGYRFRLREIFSPVPPVWDWLGVRALDDSDPSQPRVVHAFIRRSALGCRTAETRNGGLGRPTTRGGDALLHDAAAAAVLAEPEHVARVLPAGPPDDAFTFGIFGWLLSLTGTIYYAMARRAFDLAIEGAGRRASVPGGPALATHPLAQWPVAEAALRLDAIEAELDQVIADWTDRVHHGGQCLISLFAARHSAVDGANRVMDLASQIAAPPSGTLLPRRPTA